MAGPEEPDERTALLADTTKAIPTSLGADDPIAASVNGNTSDVENGVVETAEEGESDSVVEGVVEGQKTTQLKWLLPACAVGVCMPSLS
jgi:hypothetical protein